MVFTILLKNRWELQTGHPEELLQQAVLLNIDVILLVFETHYQLWNFTENKLLKKSKVNDKIFFFCSNALVGQNKVAFISYQIDRNEPYLGIYHLNTNQIQVLGNLPKQENFKGVFTFSNGDIMAVRSRGQIHLYHDQKMVNYSYSNCNVDQYNLTDTYSVYSSQHSNKGQLSLVTDGKIVKYQIPFKKQYAIIGTRQYNKQKAVLLVKSKQDHHEIVLFNLEKQVIEDVIALDIKAEYIVKGSQNNWIACQTTEKQSSSTLKVQQCFSTDRSVVEKTISLWERVPNDYFPVLLISADNGATIIENEALLKKQTFYIHFLENLNLIQEFGNEIVKQVINNLI